VGPRVDEMLRDYHRRGAFDAAVERGRYDLIWAERGGGSDVALSAALAGRQVRWLRSLGYRDVVRGPDPMVGPSVHVELMAKRS
jgi:hypothetical protein